MLKTLILSFFGVQFSAACLALSVSYSLPSNNSFLPVLKSQLTIYKRNQRPSLMMTDYGLRIHSPLSLLEKRDVQKEAEIDLGELPLDTDSLYVKSVGSSVFYNTSSNYLIRLLLEQGQNQIRIPFSSLQFSSTQEEVTEVRYDLFIADDSIYPLTESDIRKSSEVRDLNSYNSEYARHDENFEQDEPPKRSLKKVQIREKDTGLNSGYIFSACIVFREEDSKNEDKQVGECLVYSLDDQESLLPIIPGQKIRSKNSFLYLIERHQHLKGSDTIDSSWTKVSVPPDSFVSLEKSTWRPLDR